MDLGLIRQILEGKVPPVLAVILINITLLFVLWSKVNDYEPRLRALEDYILVHKAIFENDLRNREHGKK